MVAYIKIISGELQGARGYIHNYTLGKFYCTVYKPGESEAVNTSITSNQFEVIESYFKKSGVRYG